MNSIFLTIVLFIININIAYSNFTNVTKCKPLFADGSNICDIFERTSNITNNVAIYNYDNITSCNIKDKFIYSESINKDDVLKISDEKNYYCKGNNCVRMDKYYMKNMLEFPDENGNKKIYIIKTPQHYKYTCVDNICVSYNCTSDSQCLYNKCVNNLCVINSNEAIVHCDTVYEESFIDNYSSYMYCGKAYSEPCKNNSECSSKKCDNNKCQMQRILPSDFTKITNKDIIRIYVIIGIIVFISVTCCCYFFVKKHRKKNKYNKF